MKSSHQTTFIVSIYAAIDIACILLAFYLVLVLRPQTIPFVVSPQVFFSSANPFKLLFIFWTPVILFFHQTHGLYQTHREQLEGMEIWEVVKSVFVSTFVIIVLVYLLKIQDFPRSVMILNAVVIAVFCSIWRFCTAIPCKSDKAITDICPTACR